MHNLPALLAALFCCVAGFYMWRNKRLAKNLSPANATRLIRARTWQTLALLAISFTTIGYYDHALKTLRAQPTPQPVPPVAAETPAPTGSDVQVLDYYPPITSVEVLPKPSEPQPPQAQTIDDIFNAGKTSIDSVKERYEQVLVTYMFLQKCNRTRPADYQLIFSALGKEMARLQAPARMRYDVLTAARGSYQEIYAKNNCTPADVESLDKQYQHYLQLLAEKL